jgi:hypothetical protein
MSEREQNLPSHPSQPSSLRLTRFLSSEFGFATSIGARILIIHVDMSICLMMRVFKFQ